MTKGPMERNNELFDDTKWFFKKIHIEGRWYILEISIDFLTLYWKRAIEENLSFLLLRIRILEYQEQSLDEGSKPTIIFIIVTLVETVRCLAHNTDHFIHNSRPLSECYQCP